MQYCKYARNDQYVVSVCMLYTNFLIGSDLSLEVTEIVV